MDQNAHDHSTSDMVSLHWPPLGSDYVFDLKPGSFVRIGSAPEMEITLRLTGLRPFELRLNRDEGGNLIVEDGARTYVVTDGSELRIGSYSFILRDFRPTPPSAAPYLAPRWSIGPAGGRERPAVKAKRASKRGIHIAAGVVLLCVAFAVLVDRLPRLIIEAGRPVYTSDAEEPSPSGGASHDERMKRDALYPRLVADSAASEWGTAHELAKMLVEKYPGSPTAHFQAAKTAQLAHDYNAAIRRYQTFLTLEPSHAVAWYNLGLAFNSVKKESDAESAFERSVKADAKYRLAWEGLTKIRLATSKWTEGLESLIALGELDRDAGDYFVTDLLRNFAPKIPPDLQRVVDAYRSKFPEPESPSPETGNAIRQGQKMAEAYLEGKSGEDARAEAAGYAGTVSPYFRKSSGTSAEILADIDVHREEWPVRHYDPPHIDEARYSPDKSSLTIRFSFGYKTENGVNHKEGTMRQEAVFTRIGNRLWVITGIQNLEDRE